MSPESTAYLTDKCEVQNRNVTGGKAVIARDVIEPGELIAVWSGRIVTAEELDELAPEIRRHTVQVEEGLYLSSLSADEPPDFINHSCEPNAGLDGQITIVATQRIGPGALLFRRAEHGGDRRRHLRTGRWHRSEFREHQSEPDDGQPGHPSGLGRPPV